jgi:Zn-dependent protease
MVWSFRLLGFPVVVEPWFWLITLLIGAGRPAELFPPWLIAAFVSILLHELGHALMGRFYGLDSSIRLYSFGGVTFVQGSGSLRPLQDALIYLAGPMAGFAFGLVVFALAELVPFETLFARVLISDLLWINIAWGLVNLLPVLPLDGGHIMRHAVDWWTGSRDDTLALRISVAVASAFSLGALFYSNSLFIAGLFGYMAFENYQALQRRTPWRVYGRRE